MLCFRYCPYSSIKIRHLSRRLISQNKNADSDRKITENQLLNRICTLPNIITLSRIASSPFIGAAIMYDMKEYALGGCLIAAVSDWLDGAIAKNFNQKTHLGSILDPFADKIVIASITTALTYKALIPLALCGIIVGRDIFLIGGACIVRYRTLPSGVHFFDYTHSSMFSIVPSFASKVNTGLQFSLLFTSLGIFIVDPSYIGQLEPLWYATGLSTIISGLGYANKSGIVHKSNRT